MRQVAIESYPNREIRLTLVRSQSPKKFEWEEKEGAIAEPEAVSTPTCHSLKTLNGSSRPRVAGVLEIQGKPGWGGLPRFQKFSTYARRQILRAGGALERHAPHSECLFLTLTLPGSTRESLEAMARYSGFAVQRLKAWIGKRIKENLSIYTWELQKRGALHLHYVVWCSDKGVGEYIRENLKEQWIRILDAIGKASGVDLFRKCKGFSWASNKEIVRTDAQWCEKSVAAYLSKYVSKPCKYQYSQGRPNYCPSRWYGVSRPLLALLRSMSFKISLDSLRDRDSWGIYEDCLSVLQSFAIKCYQYGHVVGDGKTIVAYVNTNEQESIWNMLKVQTPELPDWSGSSEAKLRGIAQQGVYVMRKSPIWLATFRQFCANSRVDRLIASPLSPDTTRGDLTFVLDMLIYTYRYTERTRYGLDGASKLWYQNALDAFRVAISEGESWVEPLLPCKE